MEALEVSKAKLKDLKSIRYTPLFVKAVNSNCQAISIYNCFLIFCLSLQHVDTTILGLSPQEAFKSPYIASMGVYVFKTEVLLQLLKWRYPTSNDFGSEIIPSVVKERNVRVSQLTFKFCSVHISNRPRFTFCLQKNTHP